jgi:hypothetical protein
MDNLLDQAAAYAAKQLDATGFLQWLVPTALAQRRLRQWLDTRTIAFPGERDRRCDTVAGLEHEDGQMPPEAIVIEFKDRARGQAALQQLAEYALRIHRELPVQEGLPDRYAVGTVLVNLTGIQAPRVLILKALCLPGADLKFKPVIVNLETRSAPATVRGVAQGRFHRCALVWVPLMHHGEDPGIIKRWKPLALGEPDERKRADYAALALIFAEAAGRLDVWRRALEGWNMQQSSVIREWIQQGKQEGRAEGAALMLLHYLRQRFGGEVPADLRMLIEAQTDLDLLDRWFEHALGADSLDRFRAALPPQSNGQ